MLWPFAREVIADADQALGLEEGEFVDYDLPAAIDACLKSANFHKERKDDGEWERLVSPWTRVKGGC